MTAAGRVVCVGHLMIDVHAALPGPLALGSDTPATITVQHGGSAANTAAWAAWAGAPAAFAGRVGADDFGRAAVARLAAAGVRAHVAVDPAEPTGVCLVLVDRAGERTMVPSAGANARLAAADLPPIGATDRLHLSGYLLLDAATRPTALAALRAAQSAGAAVSLDASSAAPLLAAGPDVFAAAPRTALLLANAAESGALTGTADPAVAATALAERFAAVVVKDGGRPALLAAGGHVESIPAAACRVVDPTGAGDAFAGGLLAALLRGCDLAEAVHAGHVAGAHAVTTVGARPAVTGASPRRRRLPGSPRDR